MFLLTHLKDFAAAFVSFLIVIGMATGAFVVVRAVSMKGGIEALRNELTVLRSDFAQMETRVQIVEAERDGLKRDVAVHFEARLMVLEEMRAMAKVNRELADENRRLLKELAAGA